MEPPLKQSRFDTEEEAATYASSFENLPDETIVKILAENNGLSIQDIQSMCRASSRFAELCARYEIWDTIFIRQFGRKKFDEFQHIGENLPNFRLLRLLAMRCLMLTNLMEMELSIPSTFQVFKLKYSTETRQEIVYKMKTDDKKLARALRDYIGETIGLHVTLIDRDTPYLEVAKNDLRAGLLLVLMYVISRGYVMKNPAMFVGCKLCPTSAQGCSLCNTPICGEVCFEKHACVTNISCGLYREVGPKLEKPVFRNVVFTGKHMQYVEMYLQPRQEIGMERHPNTDQFFHILSGKGQLITKPADGGADHVKDLSVGIVAMIPAGIWHNVVAGEEGLSLYTLYAPPEH